MKRSSILGIGLVLAIALVLILSGGLNAQQDSAKTQEQQTVQQQVNVQAQQMNRGMNFIDENGNGICDRYEQGQGMGSRGKGGMGQNFIDEDGNGICDHRGERGMGMQQHQGRHKNSGQKNCWRNN